MSWRTNRRRSPLTTAATWPPEDWRLVACDVGQGDGLVLRAGEHSAVVVDAGPDPAAIDACLDRLDGRDEPRLSARRPAAPTPRTRPASTRSDDRGGGTARPVTDVDYARRDNAHRWPVFLPDGLHFLYFVRSEDRTRALHLRGRRGAPSSRAFDRPISSPPSARRSRSTRAIRTAPHAMCASIRSASPTRRRPSSPSSSRGTRRRCSSASSEAAAM